MRAIAALLFLGLTLAGCFDDDPEAPSHDEPIDGPRYDAASGQVVFPTDAWTLSMAPGGLAEFANLGDAAMDLEVPERWLSISGADGRSGSFSLATTATVEPGASAWFLAPPSATQFELTIDGEARAFDTTTVAGYEEPTGQFVSGENIWDLMDVQRKEFAPREPGLPGYAASIDYFAQYFEDLGYDVEVDPFGTTDLDACSPVGLNTLCAESLANIVATKPGTTTTGKTIFVGGGHYDVVPQTTEGAFDDTSGTIMTLELARALAPYEFEHDLKFGLWGGEENGILGSQFWVQTNPQAKAQVVSYWNLDVVGMSWPVPVPKPDPIVIAAGPDVPSLDGAGGTQDPISTSLLDWAQTLQRDWFGYPDSVTAPKDNSTYDVFLYEGVASGQVEGYAGVNAQSDHTPFIAGGIPSYFIFNGDALRNPIGIHNERDTLQNMTKYALYEEDFDLDTFLFDTPEEEEQAKAALARSFEATMMFPLYHALLVDLGVYTPPSVAAQVPA